jgi:hypothetical protein
MGLYLTWIQTAQEVTPILECIGDTSSLEVAVAFINKGDNGGVIFVFNSKHGGNLTVCCRWVQLALAAVRKTRLFRMERFAETRNADFALHSS